MQSEGGSGSRAAVIIYDVLNNMERSRRKCRWRRCGNVIVRNCAGFVVTGSERYIAASVASSAEALRVSGEGVLAHGVRSGGKCVGCPRRFNACRRRTGDITYAHAGGAFDM